MMVCEPSPYTSPDPGTNPFASAAPAPVGFLHQEVVASIIGVVAPNKLLSGR